MSRKTERNLILGEALLRWLLSLLLLLSFPFLAYLLLTLLDRVAPRTAASVLGAILLLFLLLAVSWARQKTLTPGEPVPLGPFLRRQARIGLTTFAAIVLGAVVAHLITAEPSAVTYAVLIGVFLIALNTREFRQVVSPFLPKKQRNSETK